MFPHEVVDDEETDQTRALRGHTLWKRGTAAAVQADRQDATECGRYPGYRSSAWYRGPSHSGILSEHLAWDIIPIL